MTQNLLLQAARDYLGQPPEMLLLMAFWGEVKHLVCCATDPVDIVFPQKERLTAMGDTWMCGTLTML